MASQVVLVLGKRGSGKSFRLRDLLRQEPRFVLYNTLGEPTYGEFPCVGSFPALLSSLSSRSAILRLNYVWDGRLDRERDFEFVCQAVYEAGNVVFAVDEIDLFCSGVFVPRHLDRIVSLGRHRNIKLYCATRRPKEIPPLIRAQAGTVISFRQTEPLDLEWCKQVMGDDAENLPTLRQFEPFVWDDAQPAAPVDTDQGAT